MRSRDHLVWKNITYRKGRSAGLGFLCACLALSVLAGALLTGALRRGLSSLEARLGADIMVVPREASIHSSIEDIFLQGNMGYFYMGMDKLEKIRTREGIGALSTQFFLVSTSSGCCSIPVQLVGIEPETDFTIMPWIRRSTGQGLGDDEVVVGSSLNAFVGDELSFYDVRVRVVGKLDRTGTSMDTGVYMNVPTIRAMIRSSLEKGMNTFRDIDPDRVVSCVLINVADGYEIEDVVNDINIHVRKVRAIQTRSMIGGISKSLLGISGLITFFCAFVWCLALAVLLAAFYVSAAGRRRELAVLRVLGASERRIRRILLGEGALLGLLGGVCGVSVGLLGILPFRTAIEEALGLPFLLPGFAGVAGLSLAALVLTVLAGVLAGHFAAGRVLRMEAGEVLREE